MQVPDFILTNDPKSFANYTLRFRFPEIIDRVIGKNSLTPEEIDRLLNLKKEIKGEKIIDPFQHDIEWIDTGMFEKEELLTWNLYISKYKEKKWFDIPWYFSEAFFYLKLLIASGYYSRNSGFYRVDPFEPIKNEELFSAGGGIETASKTARFLKRSKESKQTIEEILKELVLLSLWGNRIDLSYNHIVKEAKNGKIGKEKELLIINHIDTLVETLLHSKEIHFILDNAGSELVSDLFLAHFLLTLEKPIPFIRVVLHVKKAPFFVSDTTERDIIHTIDTLSRIHEDSLNKFAGELKRLIKEHKLVIKKHYFWNGPCGFPEMPEDIVETLSHSDLTILKGDANYRRLLSDRKWDFSIPTEQITLYFPSDFAILRTMKSEIITGMDPDLIRTLYKEDPAWLVNGKRGIIQVVKKSKAL